MIAIDRIRAQAAAGEIDFTMHAHQEMVAEQILTEEVVEAVRRGEVLEDYPEHRRGACCLLHGVTDLGRDLHIVCTTARPVLIIITVYEPRPPKWPTPKQRRPST